MMGFRFLSGKWWSCALALVLSVTLHAQQREALSGTVTSERGDVLEGVIIELSTDGSAQTQTVTTNEQGAFTVTRPVRSASWQLSFSHVGYESYTLRSVEHGAGNTLRIRLKEVATIMNEVVVIGYGSVLKKDVTGSVGSVKADKLTEIAATDVTQALQGRVSGVMVQTQSWKPGAGAQVRVRGSRSINASNEPLYVVDGIPIVDGINQVNVNDIELINVLKDASATAIYGNRGANGVILITTKKGKAGKTIIEYNGYYGIQKNQPLPELMNAAEFVEYSREAQRNSLGGTYDSKPNREMDFKNDQLVATPYMYKNMENAWAGGTYDPSKLTSTDWISYGLRTGNIQDHQVSVRGGNDKTRILLSGDYHSNKGVVRDQDYTRYSIRMNMEHSITRDLKVGSQSVYSRSVQNAGWNDVFDVYGLKSFNPLASPYEEDGVTLALFPTNNTRTPNPVTNFGKTKRLVKQDRYLANYYAELSFLDGFNVRSAIGLDYRAGQRLDFNAANTAVAGGVAPSSASNSGDKRFMYTWENILSYHKSAGEDHSFYGTVVQSIQAEKAESYGISVKDLPYEQQLYYNVGSALTINSISSNYVQWNMASFMGRLNYSFRDKYLATISARYDGSSVLASGKKWVLFPSVALGWRLRSEPFMQNMKSLSELKVRLGWGRTGNSGIEPYKTWGSLSTIRYAFGNTSALGFAPEDMINASLTWETTGQYNAGIDFGFLNNRISGTIDVYLQNTYDLLLDKQLPIASGFDEILVNVGKTRNKGIELTLNTVNVTNRKFTWSTDWIFAANKQEILELYNGKQDDIGSQWFIGQPIQVAYNVTTNGIWQDNEKDLAEMALFNANGATFKPGDIRPLDLNNDYKINAEDRHIFGQADPKWTASLGNTFQYGNFDASLFLYAAFGQTVYHDLDMRFDGRYNQPKLDYWTPENPAGKYPRPLLGTAGLNYLGNLNYYDGSFMRVKNISLGYTLPLEMIRHAGMQKFRLYASVQNPFVVTDFPGTDPEGATGFNEPSVTTYLLGVNINF